MPARKPIDLHTRHATKAEIEAREQAESAIRPERGLSKAAPARLEGHQVASAAWRKLIRLYGELKAEIVTRLDESLLVDFCLGLEELGELQLMRSTAYQVWLDLANKRSELVDAGMSDEAIKLGIQVVGAFDAVLKLDSRMDRKRALLHQLRQSLYLSPRSRSGVVPQVRPPDEVDEFALEFESLLDRGAL